MEWRRWMPFTKAEKRKIPADQILVPPKRLSGDQPSLQSLLIRSFWNTYSTSRNLLKEIMLLFKTWLYVLQKNRISAYIALNRARWNSRCLAVHWGLFSDTAQKVRIIICYRLNQHPYHMIEISKMYLICLQNYIIRLKKVNEPNVSVKSVTIVNSHFKPFAIILYKE